MAFPTSVNNQITDATASSAKRVPIQELIVNLEYSTLIANVNLSQQNAIANQQAVNELGISIVGKAVTLLGEIKAG